MLTVAISGYLRRFLTCGNAQRAYRRYVNVAAKNQKDIADDQADDIAHERLAVEVPQFRDNRVHQEGSNEERDGYHDAHLMVRHVLLLVQRLRNLHLRVPADQDADLIDGLPVDAIIPERDGFPVGVHEATVRLKGDLVLFVQVGIEIVESVKAEVVLVSQEEVLSQLVDVLNLLAQVVPRQTQIRRRDARPVPRHLLAYPGFLLVSVSQDLVVAAAFPDAVAQLADATVSDIAVGPARVSRVVDAVVEDAAVVLQGCRRRGIVLQGEDHAERRRTARIVAQRRRAVVGAVGRQQAARGEEDRQIEACGTAAHRDKGVGERKLSVATRATIIRGGSASRPAFGARHICVGGCAPRRRLVAMLRARPHAHGIRFSPRSKMQSPMEGPRPLISVHVDKRTHPFIISYRSYAKGVS